MSIQLTDKTPLLSFTDIGSVVSEEIPQKRLSNKERCDLALKHYHQQRSFIPIRALIENTTVKPGTSELCIKKASDFARIIIKEINKATIKVETQSWTGQKKIKHVPLLQYVVDPKNKVNPEYAREIYQLADQAFPTTVSRTKGSASKYFSSEEKKS
jgi:hypothetical protein